MTGPVASLPYPIKELLTNTAVLWEKAGALDVYGQPSYAPAEEIDCWMEPEGLGATAGILDSRAGVNGTILQQTRRPELGLYFDGDDSRARSFKLTDRFTPLTTASSGIAMMPTTVVTLYGPPFDNRNPWLIVVAF